MDGGKLLGHGIERAVVIRGRPHDAADNLAAAQTAVAAIKGFIQHAPPVAAHGLAQRRCAQDAGRPLDRVDLRHERDVDQSRVVEEHIVRPARVVLLEHGADGIVLAGKERMHQAQA